MFLKSLNASGTEFDKNHQYGIIVCGGIYHDQPIRKILKSEDMNIVLLASLKISDYCGRLQLIDATDSIDVVIPDLPSINDFNVVMEGFSRELETLESFNNDPFSYAKLRNRILCPGTAMEKSLKELESGRLHLLLLVHKFPAQQKFNSSIYAEAIILPWNLVYKREMVLVESSKGGDSCNEKWCDLKCIQVLVEKDIDRTVEQWHTMCPI
ncbi:hypothetical protein Tco_0813539 [Tanacetum coccineum]